MRATISLLVLGCFLLGCKKNRKLTIDYIILRYTASTVNPDPWENEPGETGRADLYLVLEQGGTELFRQSQPIDNTYPWWHTRQDSLGHYTVTDGPVSVPNPELPMVIKVFDADSAGGDDLIYEEVFVPIEKYSRRGSYMNFTDGMTNPYPGPTVHFHVTWSR